MVPYVDVLSPSMGNRVFGDGYAGLVVAEDGDSFPFSEKLMAPELFQERTEPLPLFRCLCKSDILSFGS